VAILQQELDRDLVFRLQEGDLEALGVLYDRYRHLVFRTALSITNDPESAADLLQDVFLRLFRFAHRIDPERPIQPWLYRMTANLSYTWIKRNKQGLRILNEMAEIVSRERKPSPHIIAERDEEWHKVREAIASLPLQQRIVVVLYYVNDLSMNEISEILEIPIGTVKSRLHYARIELKKKLGIHREQLREVLYEIP
jgi:RNA polymerase sigma-70 factor (ECF subfamily)